MAADLLKLSLSPPHITFSGHRNLIRRSHIPPLSHRRHIFVPPLRRNPNRNPRLTVASSIEIEAPASESLEKKRKDDEKPAYSSFLLDVNGMMCGACATRVKKILTSDDRVDSAVVNMLTETAAVRLKAVVHGGDPTAEDLAKRLTECGFESKRRVAGSGVGERVRKWKEMAAKKEELIEKSRSRVIVAWSLVALCCGGHASHLLHSVGIHVAHHGIYV